MTDPHSLLSLPPRELDARLAECMGWTGVYHFGGNTRPIGLPPEASEGAHRQWIPLYTSPSSPRSLLESVEAEIERRGLIEAYVTEVQRCDGEWLGRTARSVIAKAHIRAAAAVAVMEGK